MEGACGLSLTEARLCCDSSNMLPRQPNQSLIDGLACLQSLADAPAGVRQLARDLGLEPTRAHRLLKTLAHLGLAEQTADQRYRAGPGVHVLAATSLYASGLMPRALPALAALTVHGKTVALGTRWLDRVAYLYHAGPGMRPLEGIGRVAPYPATQSGPGMALLAASNNAQVRAVYRNRPTPGFRSVAALITALGRIRNAGHADIPRPDGQRTLSVVLIDRADAPPTAAIALAGTITDDQVPQLLISLHKAAAAIVAQPLPHVNG